MYYCPSIAKKSKTGSIFVKHAYEQKRNKNDILRTELFKCPEWVIGPEDILQMDVCPNRPPIVGYDNIITACDTFPRYLFAYPVARITATAVPRVLLDILCKHTDLPTTINLDLGTQIKAQVTHGITAILGCKLKNATLKHAQIIGTHASVKSHLKASTGEFRHKWHKHHPLAVLYHITTCHASLGCEHSRVFHGLISHNILDDKLIYNPDPKH